MPAGKRPRVLLRLCAAADQKHLQPALRYLGYREGDLPETERAARENFSVPLWAGITLEQHERVVETVQATLGVRT